MVITCLGVALPCWSPQTAEAGSEPYPSLLGLLHPSWEWAGLTGESKNRQEDDPPQGLSLNIDFFGGW